VVFEQMIKANEELQGMERISRHRKHSILNQNSCLDVEWWTWLAWRSLWNLKGKNIIGNLEFAWQTSLRRQWTWDFAESQGNTSWYIRYWNLGMHEINCYFSHRSFKGQVGTGIAKLFRRSFCDDFSWDSLSFNKVL
jgi:hypothetical protein